MKILFCTNAFENITNGPAKFANHLLKINQLYTEHKIKILTEDVSSPNEDILNLEIKYPRFLKLFSHLFRMVQYHNEAMRIKNTYDWDVIVYNNAFIGLWSGVRLNNSVGMINDDNNATVKFGLSYKKLRYSLFRILEKLSVKKHKLILVNSIYTKNILSRIYPSINKKCEILYKGIELNNIIRIPEFKEPIKVLFVKKDFARGGLLYLIKALSAIEFPIELYIVGPEEDELGAEYLNLIKKSNKKIIIKGALTQTETFNLMKKSDIFCVPSLKEALGVANIEALSFGCSVISTNVGGIPEVMDNGKNGWLVEPESSTDIKMAIIDCVKNRELRNIKRIKGYDFIKKFNIETTIRNFVSILVDNFDVKK